MFDYLEQLRKKPVAYRRRVVALTSTVLTALIVVVWLGTLSFRVAEVSDPNILEDSRKPFQEIKANIGSFYNTVVEVGTNLFSPSATTTSQ